MTYRRAGAGVLSTVLGDGSATYTPGISERRGSTTTYAHTGLKSAEAQSQSGQTITASRQYDAFGNVSSSTGTFQGYFGYAGPFGYQEDSDHSLRLLGHRYYDSDTGRFLTRDPIKDGRNWYAYGAGEANPVNSMDSNGLQATLIVHQNPGGGGLGSHLLIGLKYGNNVVYYGFYPNDPGSGGSSGSSSGGSGPGYVKIGDKAKGSLSMALAISDDERMAIQQAIAGSALEYLQGRRKGYNINVYNCADWVADILESSLPADKITPRPKKKPKTATTPKAIREWLEEWQGYVPPRDL